MRRLGTLPASVVVFMVIGSPILGVIAAGFVAQSRFAVVSPFMCFLVPGAIVAAVLWWAGWSDPGHCPWCNYDLRGSSQQCPECGKSRSDT